MKRSLGVSPSATTWGVMCRSLLPLVAIAVLTLLVATWAGGQVNAALPRVSEHPWLDIWLQVELLLFGAALLGLSLSGAAPSWRWASAVGVLSLFLNLALFLTLRDTPYGPGGIAGDRGTLTAQVTKFAAYSGNVDAYYHGLPTATPPLYPYLLGQVAAWRAIEPHRMPRYGLLTIALLLPFLTFWAWHPLVGERQAALVAFSALLVQEWLQPEAWLGLALFVPWWLHWVERVGSAPSPSSPWRVPWWGMGVLVGSGLALTVPDCLVIGGVGQFLLRGVRRGLPAPPENSGVGRQTLWLFVGILLLTWPVWGSYLASVQGAGVGAMLAPRPLALESGALPFPFLAWSVRGAIFAGGLLFLLAQVGRERVATGVLGLLLGTYLWAMAGYIGVAWDYPFITIPIPLMVEYLLALGALLALGRFWHETPPVAWLRQHELSYQRLRAALLCILLLFFGQEVGRWLASDHAIEQARASEPLPAKLAALDTLIAEPMVGKVILTSDESWLAYRPLFTFLADPVASSHPAADARGRVAFLKEMVTLNDPTLVAAALRYNRYDAIDHLLLEPVPGGWQLPYRISALTETEETITFPDALLTLPAFQSDEIEGTTILSPIPPDEPVTEGALAQPETLPLERLAFLYALVATLDEHLALADQEHFLTIATEQLTNADLRALPNLLLRDLHAASVGTLRENAQTTLRQRMNLPLDQVLVDSAGKPTLRLLGYRLDSEPEGVRLTLLTEAIAPPEEAYTIWIHAIAGETQHNAELVPQRPTSTWQLADLYLEQGSMILEPGRYQLTIGFWRSEDGSRLLLDSGGYEIDLGTHTLP